jgi:hypothetical protein
MQHSCTRFSLMFDFLFPLQRTGIFTSNILKYDTVLELLFLEQRKVLLQPSYARPQLWMKMKGQKSIRFSTFVSSVSFSTFVWSVSIREGFPSMFTGSYFHSEWIYIYSEFQYIPIYMTTTCSCVMLIHWLIINYKC